MTRRRVWLWLLSLLCIGILIFVFTGRKMAQSKAFIVLPGARDIHYSTKYGDQVRYEMIEEYPAEKTIKAVSDRLIEQGWKPIDKDVFTHKPYVQEKDFVFFVDGHRKPSEQVRRISSQWINSKSDIMIYNLEYRWVNDISDTRHWDIPDNDRLQVLGLLIPSRSSSLPTPTH